MAIRDLEAFLRQRAGDFDPNMDVSPGSPFDAKVIQPLLRRTGIDPFTVDLLTFVTARLQQLYPRLASDDGDNITDLLIKPATLLWDPVVRENTRVRQGLSFADPATLTLDEADALGGNFFTPRRRGQVAKGPGRIYFATPQNVTVTQNNFVTSRGGLVFFPSEVQSIRSAEMLLNVDAEGLYYFDVNLIASQPGDAYNLGPNELISIANLPAAVRVTNLRRFRFGEPEESAVEYVRRLELSLGEKSMDTLRGIAAKVLEAFPEVQRLNVVGFGDPEMQRDVVRGGGLGTVLAAGVDGAAVSDAEGQLKTRRFYTTEVDFQALVGLSGTGLVLTIINPYLVYGANDPFGTIETSRDLEVRRVIDANTLDLEEQVLIQGALTLPWTLRRKELTLSGIPGGVLFPDGANGTVVIPDDTVHIGGMDDIHVRATDFDDATLTLQNVADDEPVLSGVQGRVTAINQVTLSDHVLDVNYVFGDAVYESLADAAAEGFSLQIVEGPNAGTHRVVSVSQLTLGAPVLTLAENLVLVEATNRRWRLFDDINVDLVDPKETRISDDDLVTTQGSDIVTTLAGTDFDAYGVAKGDTLRIVEGPEQGDFGIVADPPGPSFNTLQIDRPFPRTLGATKYTIFRPNGESLQRPLVRIRSIELLDSSSQPQGSFIPYAKPVDVQSRAFQNPARGVKHEYRNARLGLLTAEATSGLFTGLGAGATLTIAVFRRPPLTTLSTTIVLPGPAPSIAQVISSLSAAILALTGSPAAAYQVSSTRVGIRPVSSGVVAIVGGTGMTGLFGNTEVRTTADIRVDDIEQDPVAYPNGWASLSPEIDAVTGLDVAQIVDGVNAGFYPSPFVVDFDLTPYGYTTAPSKALVLTESVADFVQGKNTSFLAPETSRRVRVGARSLGSVRVYFLEPTTFEVNPDTVFEFDTGRTGVARFYPDPTLYYQQIPPLPDGVIPDDGSSPSGGTTFTSASQQFIRSGIKPGDQLVIENFPVTGTQVLANPVVGLVGQTLIFSIDGGPDRTLIFIRDDVSLNPTEVSRDGVINQINAMAGSDIAELDGSNRVKFVTDLSLVIRRTSTALPTILGNILGHVPVQAFSAEDVTNASPHAGEYEVTDVPTATTLTLSPALPTTALTWPTPITGQTFRVQRKGVQRCSTTQMASNLAEAGLYYFDVELVSEGTGDFWNIDADQQLVVNGYKSDGYYLTTDDANLAFSDVEPVKLVVSRTILEQGVDDDPQNATQVTGQNLLIRYDRSTTVTSIQNFAQSDFERAVGSNPLARHLIPHFVRFDATYFGGSAESVVVPDVEKLIRDLYPIDSLDASAVQKAITDRGATKVTNPLTLIALVYYTDRTVYAQRSRDSLSTGRLSAFIPDLLNIVRKVG